MTTREDAVRSAARHVVEGLARQDARSPHDAAVASLGLGATEAQIAEWVATYRPEAEAVTRELTEEQNDVFAEVALDIDERLATGGAADSGEEDEQPQ